MAERVEVRQAQGIGATVATEGCGRPLRERRLQAGKMLQWSILSESPSSYAAKRMREAAGAIAEWRKARPEANEVSVGVRPE